MKVDWHAAETMQSTLLVLSASMTSTTLARMARMFGHHAFSRLVGVGGAVCAFRDITADDGAAALGHRTQGWQ